MVSESRRGMGVKDIVAQAAPRAAGGKGGNATFQISRAGGGQPVWRGKSIFYIASDGKMMRTPVETGDALSVGTPEALFDTGIREDLSYHPRQYDVSPDGKWFVFREDASIGREPPLTVVLNWQKLVK
jgi:hypothetical protein